MLLLTVLVIILLVIDLGQTLDIKNFPDQHETNPILGRHPVDSRVWIYFLLCLAAYTIFAVLVWTSHPLWLKVLSLCLVCLEVPVIVNNHRLGLRLKFW